MVCHDEENAFCALKRETCKAARELGYGEEVVDRINNAKTTNEVNRIMISARKELSARAKML